MTSSEYEKSLEYLFARTTGGVKFGLERTLALLDALGNPQRKVPCFHVAGTNGKGSTVAFLAAMLRHKGNRVGTYTSPHLIDFRERVIVDGTPIGEEDVVRFIRDHLQLIESLGATFFEATTAMAFDHIARAGADVSVIEVGLGGRLDATNVVDPLAAIVTSIGLDHTDYLGNTLEAIAAEKAGTFKKGRPAIIGEPDPLIEAFLVVAARKAAAAPIDTVNHATVISNVRVAGSGTRFRVRVGAEEVEANVGLIGAHQPRNALCAWLALRAAGPRYALPLADLGPVLEDVTLAGRFQRIGNLIFDVAHNPAGTAVLAESLRSVAPQRPITVLLAVLGDKDWRGMLSNLSGVADRMVVTMPPTAPADRRWKLDDVRAFAAESSLSIDPFDDFEAALESATSRGGTTLITGSFHTVGDAMTRLQVNPLAR